MTYLFNFVCHLPLIHFKSYVYLKIFSEIKFYTTLFSRITVVDFQLCFDYCSYYFKRIPMLKTCSKPDFILGLELFLVYPLPFDPFIFWIVNCNMLYFYVLLAFLTKYDTYIFPLSIASILCFYEKQSKIFFLICKYFLG